MHRYFLFFNNFNETLTNDGVSFEQPGPNLLPPDSIPFYLNIFIWL